MGAIVVYVSLESGIELNISVGTDGRMLAMIRNHPGDRFEMIPSGGLGDIVAAMRNAGRGNEIPAEERQVSRIVSAMLAD